jgi:PAS domain S-box-containing protein
MLVAVIVVTAISSALYLREANQLQTNILDREAQRMRIFSDLVGGQINTTIIDLQQLASGDKLQDYLASGNPADLDRAEKRAAFLSRLDLDYDKIRYLDEAGKEVFRINRGGVIVPHDQLQDKGARPFFQNAVTLAADQVYLSAFDLNVDQGVIEQPIKPTLRFELPIFDGKGQRRGVYVVNYLGADLIEQLQNFVPQYQQRLRILNAQGYWIKGATPEEEWGFALPGRSGMTLAQQDPALWAQISRAPMGQVPYAGGYFTWRKIIPHERMRSRGLSLVSEDDFLVIASQISPQEYAANFVPIRQTYVVVALILLVLAMVIIWFFRARRQVKMERDRFFNLTRDMLCIAGFDGYFKRVNSAWEESIGYSQRELLAKPFIEFVHPEDREKTIAETKRLELGKETINFENRYRCKNGTYRWLTWSARSLVREQIIFASARDLTERKQMEESLRQSEERIRLMVENIKDYAIIMLDPRGKIVSWNSGAERIKGYGAQEIIGKHFSCFYPEQKRLEKFPEKELQDAINKGRSEDEGWRVRRDGSQFWASVVITAIRNTEGKLIGFVKVTRDITSPKEAAERIQKLNEELQQRAELLQVANDELESFSYSVSHDLRAPLRHIHGFVDLLRKDSSLEKDETSQRYMGIIAKAAREMGMLIDDLLALSRTGRAEMHPSEVNMRDLIDQIIQERELECLDRDVTWKIGPLPGVGGDASLLRLVWTNLLDNALKYTRRSEHAVIEIGQVINEKNGAPEREVVFFVRDNGVGFDMNYASKLFGVFQRLHRVEDFEGTGIGLANVQRIVHRHGGRVWAEAKVGSGATFYFSMPVVAVQT